jgi:hypothetical protein
MRAIAVSDSLYVFWTDSEPDLTGANAPEPVITDSIVIDSVGGSPSGFNFYKLRGVAVSDGNYVYWTSVSVDLTGDDAPEPIVVGSVVVESVFNNTLPENIDGCLLNLDSDLGITTSEASIEADLSQAPWAETDCNIVESASQYQFQSTNTGTTNRNIENTITNLENHAYTTRVSFTAGTNGWFLLSLDDGNCDAYVNAATGAVGTTSGANYVSATTIAVSGGYQLTLIADGITGSGNCILSFTSADGTATSTSSVIGELLGTAWGLSVEQSRVSAWVDQTGNTDVIQGTANQQPLYVGNTEGMVFDGVNDNLVSNVILSTLRYLHSECTIIIACNRTDTGTASRFFSTSSGVTTSNIGMSIRSDPTLADSFHVYVLNGSGSSRAINDGSTSGAWGTGKYVSSFYFDSSDYDVSINGDSSVGIGGSTGTLATGSDPDGQLIIGGGLTDFGGTIYQILAYNRKLNTNEIVAIENYLSQRWSIPFSIASAADIASLYGWLRGDYGITTSDASINQDPSIWNKSNCSLPGTSFPATLTESTDGSPVIHQTYRVPTNSEANHASLYTATLSSVNANRDVQFIYTSAANVSVFFDLQGGTVTSSGGTSYLDSSITDNGDGSMTISISYTDNGSGPAYLRPTAVGSGTYTGDGRACFTIDSVSITQQRVSAWADQENSFDFEQSTAAQQPLLLSETPQWFECDGVDDHLVTTLAQSNYRWIHDGTGGTVVFLFRPQALATGAAQIVCGTSNGGVNVGLNVQIGGASTTLLARIVTGAGAIASTTTGALTVGREYIVAIRFDSNRLKTQWWDNLGNTDVTIDDSIGTVDTGDSAQLFRIGSYNGPTNPTEADYSEFEFYNEFVSDANIGQLVSMLKTLYGHS